MSADDWTPLLGGYVNTVSRRGAVVRRQKSAASPAIHQLLMHLEWCRLPYVPRLLEQTSQSQTYEYLSYLPGTPVFRPWPDAVKTNLWLRDLGSWLRSYHDAVRGFHVQNATFAWGPADPTATMIVCHGDLGPWNLLHEQGRLTGVIDWDLARYGDPLDDVAELALEAVPLTTRFSQAFGEAATAALLRARLDTFCTAYGTEVRAVSEHIPHYLHMVIDDVRRHAAAGEGPFRSFAQGGIPEGLEDDLRYVLGLAL